MGLGNVVAGLIGAVPGAGATTGTVANIRAGGRSRVSGVLCATILLALVLGLGRYIGSVPHAVLASILMKIGFEIVDWRFLSRFRHVQREQFVVMMLTLGFTVFVDLVIAVAVGLIAAAMASARQFERLELDSVISVPLLDATFLGGPDDFGDFDPFSARVGLVSLRGTFTAASSKKLITTMRLDTREHEVVILDFSKTVYMDESAALVVERMIDAAISDRTECIVEPPRITSSRTWMTHGRSHGGSSMTRRSASPAGSRPWEDSHPMAGVRALTIASVAAAVMLAGCGVSVREAAPTGGTSTSARPAAPVTTTPVTTSPATTSAVTTTPVTTSPATTSAVTTTPVTTSPATTSAVTTRQQVAEPGCGAPPDEFRSEGRLGVLGDAASGERRIARLSTEGSGACERFEVILNGPEAAPAAVPPVADVELLSAAGVVRIRFGPAVTGTEVTDSVLGGRLAERAFVVRGLDGGIFVDVHLSAEVAARAYLREDTGALVVELRDLGGPAPGFPVVSRFVVVTGPTGRFVDYPLAVTGYARTFEANVIGEFRTDEGREIVAVTSAADYIEMWGEFRLEIEAGPSGRVTLFVGDYPPLDDAPPEGVELEFVAG